MENIVAKPLGPAPQLSPRAKAIARGLRRIGRLAGTIGLEVDDRWVAVRAASDRFYFIAIDGSQLRRGEDVSTADELQPGFLDAMALLGTKNDVVTDKS